MIGSEPGLNWVPLGRLLVDGRVLTQEQLDFALGVKVESGKRLGEIVVDLGFTTERAIAGALAEQYELEYVDLAGAELDRDAVALLTEALARRYDALPIRILPDGIPLLAVTTRPTLPTPTTCVSLSARPSASRSPSARRSSSRSHVPIAARCS
jgi:hypothetical protein